MKIIEHTQGSKEWLSWRHSGLGGSDIPAVMGICQYKTPLELWEIKCGFRAEAKTNRAMQHGHDHEPICRLEMEAHFGKKFVPICIQHDENPWMLASLDGYHEDMIIEIKCPLSDKTLDTAIQDDRIHESWVSQIHWQMIVSGIETAYLGMYDWRNESITIRKITPPHAELRAQIIDTATRFWGNVVSGVPPECVAGDYEECHDEKLKENLDYYANLMAQKKIIERDIGALRLAVIDKISHMAHNVRCGSYTICRTPPRRSYDIESMRVNGIEVEKYLKPPSGQETYTIRMPRLDAEA